MKKTSKTDTPQPTPLHREAQDNYPSFGDIAAMPTLQARAAALLSRFEELEAVALRPGQTERQWRRSQRELEKIRKLKQSLMASAQKNDGS